MNDSSRAGGEKPIHDRIITRVAEHEAVDPLDLPPLQESVDAEALDALYRRTGVRDYPEIVFGYAGCRVRITEHRRVHVEHDVD